ncbi:MAG: nucleoside triphosphate pyrophosphohydrolase family protein [Sarcina sp.]
MAIKEFKEYQEKIEKTRNFKDTELANYALGLVCEAGEAGDILKKHLYHGHSLDLEKLKLELGDVMWYLGNLCNLLNIDLEEVAEKNIEKLEKRYPKGFSEKESRERIDEDNRLNP